MPVGMTEMRVTAITLGVFVVALVIWITLAQLASSRASVEMINPATGERVVCQASMTGGKAELAVALCEDACQEKGFELLPGQFDMDIEFASQDAARRAAMPFEHLFPSACRH